MYNKIEINILIFREKICWLSDYLQFKDAFDLNFFFNKPKHKSKGMKYRHLQLGKNKHFKIIMESKSLLIFLLAWSEKSLAPGIWQWDFQPLNL